MPFLNSEKHNFSEEKIRSVLTLVEFVRLLAREGSGLVACYRSCVIVTTTQGGYLGG